jgi:hypothetical protein
MVIRAHERRLIEKLANKGGISCANETVEKSPSEDKAHKSSEQVTDPQISDGRVEVRLGLDVGAKGEDEQRDDQGAQGVEEEAGEGFETKNTSSNTEEGGSQGADVGDGLQRGGLAERVGVEWWEMNYSKIVHHALLHDRVDGQFAFVQHV